MEVTEHLLMRGEVHVVQAGVAAEAADQFRSDFTAGRRGVRGVRVPEDVLHVQHQAVHLVFGQAADEVFQLIFGEDGTTVDVERERAEPRAGQSAMLAAGTRPPSAIICRSV